MFSVRFAGKKPEKRTVCLRPAADVATDPARGWCRSTFPCARLPANTPPKVPRIARPRLLALDHHRPEAPEGLAQAGGPPHDRSGRPRRCPRLLEPPARRRGAKAGPAASGQAEPQGRARLGEEAGLAAHVHQSRQVEQWLGVLELDPVQQFRIIVLRRVHTRRDRPHRHGLGWERPQQIGRRLVSAEP
jgi:hypothetical protein